MRLRDALVVTLLSAACTTTEGDEPGAARATVSSAGASAASGAAGKPGRPAAGNGGAPSAGASGAPLAGASGATNGGHGGGSVAGGSGAAGGGAAGSAGTTHAGGSGSAGAAGSGNAGAAGSSNAGAAGATCGVPNPLGWVATTPLSFEGPMAAALGGRVHAFQGLAHAVWSPADATWQSLAPSPKFVDAVVTHQDRLVVVMDSGAVWTSDATGESLSDTSFVLPNPRRVWLTSTPLGVVRVGMLFKDRKSDLFDPTTGERRDLPEVPFTLDVDGAASTGTTLYAMGDDDLATTRLAALELSSSQPTWTMKATLTPRQPSATPLVIDGVLWRFGGAFGQSGADTTALFDPVANRWCEGPALPVGVTRPAVVRLGAEVVLLGGHDSLTQLHGVFRAKLP